MEVEGTTAPNAPQSQTLRDPEATRFDHGSEHPSASIPFRAIIDGRQFNGSSLSLVQAQVAGLAGPELDGKSRIAILRFDFNGFAVALPVDVRISRTRAETGELRLDFVNPTGDHLPTLRFLLNSYIAGDVMSVDRIIGLRHVETTPASKAAQRPRTVRGAIGSALRFSVVMGATAVLAAIVINLAYTRILSQEAPQLASISSNGQVLRAVANGQISYLNAEARKGDVVYSLRSNSGDTLNVAMPCDCKAIPREVAEGSTVLAGEPLLEVVSEDAKPLIVATLPTRMAKALVNGDVAELTFADGTTAQARPATAPRSFDTNAAAHDEIVVKLEPTTPVNGAEVNGPVTVRVVNDDVLAIKQKLTGLFTAVAGERT